MLTEIVISQQQTTKTNNRALQHERFCNLDIKFNISKDNCFSVKSQSFLGTRCCMKLGSYLSVFSIKVAPACKIMEIFFQNIFSSDLKKSLQTCQTESHGTGSSMEVCPKSNSIPEYPESIQEK